LRLLAAAPHRLLFLVGASNVLLAMIWWGYVLAGGAVPAVAGLPPSWLHAFLMQYQVLPAFIFGFLLTVHPRWTSQQALSPWHYVPVGLGLFGGQLLTLAAAWSGSTLLLHVGWLQTLAGWISGIAILLWSYRRTTARDPYVLSTLAALVIGLAGVLVFGAWLHGGDLGWLRIMVTLGVFGLLLPIYLTVALRVFPFFAANVVDGYVLYRPIGFLPLLWVGVLGHLACELAGYSSWRWLPDLLLTGALVWILWRWWPRAKAPPLLMVLFVGMLWLPLGLWLHVLDSARLALGLPGLGTLPLHTIAVGFFGSILVAMVTRVTAGHSGRPLQLGRVAGTAFVAMQLVTVLRMLGSLLPDPAPWLTAAAVGWVLAFTPWVLHSARIWLTPRVDGKPG
jgi:uncharacterized protein involved in response to NO